MAKTYSGLFRKFTNKEMLSRARDFRKDYPRGTKSKALLGYKSAVDKEIIRRKNKGLIRRNALGTKPRKRRTTGGFYLGGSAFKGLRFGWKNYC